MLASQQDHSVVRRLVLVNAVGPTSHWLPDMHARALERLSASERDALDAFSIGDLEVADPDVHSAYSRAIYPAWFNDQEMSRQFAPPRVHSATGANVAARLRREGYDWTELIPQITADTLIVHGEADLLPPDVAHALNSAVPRSRLALIPQAGHMPFWEAPELFFRVVRDFLSRD